MAYQDLAENRLLLVQEEPKGPSQLIEVLIPAQAVSTVPLPLIQQLQSTAKQSIIIKGLRLVTFAELANAPNAGLANAVLTELQKMSILVYAEGWQKGYNIPVLSLNDTFIEGSGIPVRTKSTRFNNWQDVDWNKTALVYSNGTPSNGTAYSVLFDVQYERFDINGKVIIGPSA